MARSYESKRDDIIQAAEDLLLEGGLAALKTDTIIARSGVSKGGFFYHFASIDELLKAAAVKLHKDFNREIEKERGNLPPGPGTSTRAYVTAFLYLGKADEYQRMMKLGKAWVEILIARPDLFADFAEDPGIIADYYSVEHLKSTDPEVPIWLKTIVMLAIDGMWLLEALGMRKFSEDERRKISSSLVTLIQHPPTLNSKDSSEG